MLWCFTKTEIISLTSMLKPKTGTDRMEQTAEELYEDGWNTSQNTVFSILK